VLVTINYRLGVFGFLASSDLAKEQGGTQATTALWTWCRAAMGEGEHQEVRRDPDNVTIFGESAGSFAVSTLMASPMAKGCSRRASAKARSLQRCAGARSLSVSEKKGDEFVASLGATTLADLRAVPADKVLAAVLAKKAGFSTVIDGKLLTESVPDTYAAVNKRMFRCWQAGTATKAAFLPTA